MKLHLASSRIKTKKSSPFLCQVGFHTIDDGSNCCDRCKQAFSEEEIRKQNQNKDYIWLSIGIIILFCVFGLKS